MTAPLWTSDEAVAATGGSASAPFVAGGISIDTRTLEEGDLFIALKGDNRDGHVYVADALAKGAAAALVSEPVEAKGPLLRVQDTLKGLNALGAASRKRSRAKIVAVTGSVGKTSTKEALRVMLAGFGEAHASAASYNNHWGVPLSLARMSRAASFGIFEIGMNHAGEIAPLARLVTPHAAIVTTVEPVHIEFFSSVEAIAEEKGEIFSGLVRGGTAIVNRDNPYFTLLRSKAERFGARVLGFGAHKEADAQLVALEPEGEGARVTAVISGRPLTYYLGAPGRHMALNSLSVLCCADAFGLDLAQAARKLGELIPPKGRGARSRIKGPAGAFTLIDESYNANPASMRAAFALLGEAKPGPAARRIAVLGDMLELGPGGPAYHAGLLEAIEQSDTDLVYVSGTLMEHLWDVLPPYRRGAKAGTAQDLAALLTHDLRAGDVVMVKGSFGSRMGLVVDALKSLASEAGPQSWGQSRGN
jgi:UDP-N-acetylmuramoyl-tripeptide--D-alanyl-D-alanine ligase